ncbi:MAG: oligoendopeptidase F [Pirellulaceae bacterium]|jgi:oligoendopeptidase F|nr:oligoendopeptidase F [Thermoguttaceae bacterium]MDI9446953.1 oligoendopeptidase F [Planctomycetota bacterium]NLZ03303.1 oligoendopeptidase F [Pirellulaceae bacterium]
MSNVRQLPPRSAVRVSDTWDLSRLYASDDAWERDFNRWEKRVAGYARFQGGLAAGAEALAACLKFDRDFDRLGERLGTYAFLKTAEDATRDEYQRMYGRYLNAASRAAQASSYIRPEILAIRAARLNELAGDRRLAPFRLWLERLVRYKPHTLSKKEERLLAMQTEMAQTAGQVFRKLNDADLKFGTVKNEQGQSIELTHASFTALLHSPKRSVRRTAFEQLYRQYDAHRHALAAALEGSIQRDVYYARARNFPSALEAALFPDRVPPAVYDNLVASVHKRLPALYRYYDVRRRKMRLKQLHHYDTYVPILSELRQRHTWNEAVSTVLAALEPLGSEYCGTLQRGLRGRWCDRYENRGKQSGAFSCGCYDGEPYILMNYQEDVLDHVFTLAHEAGHSMHSHYAARSQPYQYYNYAIFVAEVASTFNEELLSRHLLAQAGDDQRRAYLVNRRIDAMRATIFRQTMFAEFEKQAHASAESGEPLTVDRFRSLYRELLERYFGPDFAIDDALSLECFRIPHFYRAFYVYKYATGMSAAIALAQRVAGGGKRQLDDYLGFLKAGCSQDPLDLLRDAGVDMLKPDAIDAALEEFEQLVDELDRLV